MKKIGKILAFILVIVMTSVFMFACSCGPSEELPGAPIEKTGVLASFALDLNGDSSKEIAVADYIDENGADGVTYNVKKNKDYVNVTAVTNGKFTVTGVSVGEAIVTLEALQSGEVKVSVNLTFDVTDSTAPLEKTGAPTSFTLDLYDTKIIAVNDYIDENGAAGVTYNVKKNKDNVDVTALTDGKFTVTGAKVGEATVTIEALQNNEVKISKNLNFDVVESEFPGWDSSDTKLSDIYDPNRPDYGFDYDSDYEWFAKYFITGVVNGTGYTMSGDPTVAAGGDYTFKVTVDTLLYTGTPVVAYMIDGVLQTPLTGTNPVDGVYTFTIENVSGNIALARVAGIRLANYSVGIAKGAGYTISGDSSVEVGGDYTFTLTVDSRTIGIPVVNYTLGGEAQTALTGVNPNNLVYTFMISKVIGNIVITDVTGLSITYNVTGIADGADYTMAGGSTVAGGADYSFTVTVDGGYIGLPVIYYTMGGETQPRLVGNSPVSGVYTFTIKNVIGDIGITSVEAKRVADLALEKSVTASSEQSGNDAINVVDGTGGSGTVGTRWASATSFNAGGAQWIRVDLGDNYDITRVNITWYGATGSRIYYYTIDISDDDINWTTAVDKNNNTAHPYTEDAFTANARFVRIYVTGVSVGTYSPSLFTFSVYAINDAPPPTATLAPDTGVTFAGGSLATELYTGDALPAVVNNTANDIAGWYNVDDTSKYWKQTSYTLYDKAPGTDQNGMPLADFSMPKNDTTIAPFFVETGAQALIAASSQTSNQSTGVTHSRATKIIETGLGAQIGAEVSYAGPADGIFRLTTLCGTSGTAAGITANGNYKFNFYLENRGSETLKFSVHQVNTGTTLLTAQATANSDTITLAAGEHTSLSLTVMLAGANGNALTVIKLLQEQTDAKLGVTMSKVNL